MAGRRGFELQQAETPDPAFAPSQEVAEERYRRYRDLDPFPSIPPTLLNSAELADYVAAAGVIHPFHYGRPDDPDPWLKMASYRVELGGRYVYWDENGQRRSEVIEAGQEFVLPANSIAFVTLAPIFRLPNYLALRHNLRITHVYQGILLGTGPLVDPGFHGQLSIPLHNLTTNNYVFRGGEGVIWVEITKIVHPGTARALAQNGGQDLEERRGRLFALAPSKLDLDITDYLRKADPNHPIRSSVPTLIREADRRVAEARIVADQARTTAEQSRLAGIVGSVIALVAVILGAIGVYLAVHTVLDALSARVDAVESRIDGIQKASPSAAQSPLVSPVSPSHTP